MNFTLTRKRVRRAALVGTIIMTFCLMMGIVTWPANGVGTDRFTSLCWLSAIVSLWVPYSLVLVPAIFNYEIRFGKV